MLVLDFAGRPGDRRTASRKARKTSQALVAFFATTPSYRVAASPLAGL